jgi:hypothetical protein
MLPRAIFVTALLALAAPASAAAQWAPPTSLTGDLAAAFRPQVTFSGRGDRVVGYGAGRHFAWSFTPPGSDAPFGQRPSSTTDPFARLLPYASSRVLLVSRTSGRLPWELRARFGGVETGVGAVRRLAPGQDVLDYDAAIDARGNAVVAFVRNVRGARNVIRKRVVSVVRRPAGGSFGRPEIIAGTGSPTAVAAAVGRDGELAVAYERAGRVLVRRREARHSWTSPQDLGPAARSHTQLSLAGAADGTFALGWFSQALSEGGDNGAASVRLTLRSARGHRFHTARLFETFAQRAPQDAGIRVALAADGTGVAGWTGRQGDHFVARVADVASSAAQTVSNPAADAQLGDVAAGANGAAVAVWAPPLDAPAPQVFAATRASTRERFGGPEAVSAVSREIAAPAVGIDPRTGRALAAWVARTGDRTQAVLAALRS